MAREARIRRDGDGLRVRPLGPLPGQLGTASTSKSMSTSKGMSGAVKCSVRLPGSGRTAACMDDLGTAEGCFRDGVVRIINDSRKETPYCVAPLLGYA